VVRGRPNWWVILAVSLALMALLVATAGTAPRGTGHPGAVGSGVASDAHRPSTSGNRSATAPGGRADGGTAATTSTTLPARPFAPSQTPTTGTGSALLDNHSNATTGTSPSTVPPVTTTTLPPTTTTTTAPSAALPADRIQTQGYLSPPLQTSNSFAFTGTGAMQISVLWSGSTYLTMKVSCPNGSQSVGGTAAMAASLPDASGSCLATVSEPASETASLTYTITIGPAGA
jgi:hypothetical protein